MTPKRIQTAITLLRANGYRVHKIGAPAIRPRIEGCDAACTEAKHTRACLARKYRRKGRCVCTTVMIQHGYLCPSCRTELDRTGVKDGSPLADKIAANQMRDE